MKIKQRNLFPLHFLCSLISGDKDSMSSAVDNNGHYSDSSFGIVDRQDDQGLLSLDEKTLNIEISSR